MIRINQLKLNIAHTQSDLERKILKTLHKTKRFALKIQEIYQVTGCSLVSPL